MTATPNPTPNGLDPVTLGEVYRMILATHDRVESLQADLRTRSHHLAGELQKVVMTMSVMGTKQTQLEHEISNCPALHQSAFKAELTTRDALIDGRIDLMNERITNVKRSAGLVALVITTIGGVIMWVIGLFDFLKRIKP